MVKLPSDEVIAQITRKHLNNMLKEFSLPEIEGDINITYSNSIISVGADSRTIAQSRWTLTSHHMKISVNVDHSS